MNASITHLANIIDAVIDLSPTAPTKVRELAVRHGLKPRHFEVSFKLLAAQGILRSRRGSMGGYLLNRGLRQVTVAGLATALGSNQSQSGTVGVITRAAYAGWETMTLENIRMNRAQPELKQ